MIRRFPRSHRATDDYCGLDVGDLSMWFLAGMGIGHDGSPAPGINAWAIVILPEGRLGTARWFIAGQDDPTYAMCPLVPGINAWAIITVPKGQLKIARRFIAGRRCGALIHQGRFGEKELSPKTAELYPKLQLVGPGLALGENLRPSRSRPQRLPRTKPGTTPRSTLLIRSTALHVAIRSTPRRGERK
jgi:hypothetical protein